MHSAGGLLVEDALAFVLGGAVGSLDLILEWSDVLGHAVGLLFVHVDASLEDLAS